MLSAWSLVAFARSRVIGARERIGWEPGWFFGRQWGKCLALKSLLLRLEARCATAAQWPRAKSNLKLDLQWAGVRHLYSFAFFAVIAKWGHCASAQCPSLPTARHALSFLGHPRLLEAVPGFNPASRKSTHAN